MVVAPSPVCDLGICITFLKFICTFNNQFYQVQYKFLYKCLNEITTLGSTVLTLSDVPAFLNSDDFVRRTQEEYQVKHCMLVV